MKSAEPLRYAGFWKRFAAYGYDASIVSIAAILLRICLGSVHPFLAHSGTLYLQAAGGGGADAMLNLWDGMMDWLDQLTRDSAFISAPYTILFTAGSWQATPGKRFCHIMVVNANGSKLTLLQSTLRHAASGLSVVIYYLGFFTIFFTREKLALHDMICKTRVVYGRTTAD